MGVLFFFHPGGRACVGMGSAGFLGQVGCKERAEKTFQKSSSPCLCICKGVEAAQCRSKWHRAVCCVFLFLKKKKVNLGVTQKWVITLPKTCLFELFALNLFLKII